MQLFNLLESLFNVSHIFLTSIVCLIVTELCLRYTFGNKKLHPHFWLHSFTVAIIVFLSMFFSFESAISGMLNKMYEYSPFFGFLTMFGLPIAVGLTLGYGIFVYRNQKLLKKDIFIGTVIVNFITTWLITTILAIILFIGLLFTVIDTGSNILQQTYTDFHLFNQHIRSLCAAGQCPKDTSEIKAFNPERYRYLDLMTDIQYTYNDVSKEYTYSVKFNEHRVLSSNNDADMLYNSEDEAVDKGLWR